MPTNLHTLVRMQPHQVFGIFESQKWLGFANSESAVVFVDSGLMTIMNLLKIRWILSQCRHAVQQRCYMRHEYRHRIWSLRCHFLWDLGKYFWQLSGMSQSSQSGIRENKRHNNSRFEINFFADEIYLYTACRDLNIIDHPLCQQINDTELFEAERMQAALWNFEFCIDNLYGLVCIRNPGNVRIGSFQEILDCSLFSIANQFVGTHPNILHTFSDSSGCFCWIFLQCIINCFYRVLISTARSKIHNILDIATYCFLRFVLRQR